MIFCMKRQTIFVFWQKYFGLFDDAVNQTQEFLNLVALGCRQTWLFPRINLNLAKQKNDLAKVYVRVAKQA